MAALIGRLRGLLGGDTQLTDDDLQTLLDDHAFETLRAPLIARPPAYVRHVAPYANLEEGAAVYVALTPLVEGVDYSIDLQRGIVSTPTAEHRVLELQGVAYDINAAAADGWERIAARHVANFDFSANNASHRRSQQYDQALQQAAAYRAKAWPVSATVERGDTAAGNRAGDLLDGFREHFS